MVSSKRVIDSIRTGARGEVVKAYSAWHHQDITTEEFATWMFDIRITSLAMVESMEYFDIINEDERETLDRFIRSLTDTYC
jgi:hypothetical protein